MTQGYVTLYHPKTHLYKILDPYLKRYEICSENDYSRNEVIGQVHSDCKMVNNTPQSQDAATHQIWDPYLKEYRR